MQRHKRRNELWCFLSGKGEMWVGGKQNAMGYFDVTKGDSIAVPHNNWHQFKAEKSTLVLEIQYGDKCEESDIERRA